MNTENPERRKVKRRLKWQLVRLSGWIGGAIFTGHASYHHYMYDTSIWQPTMYIGISFILMAHLAEFYLAYTKKQR